jgi:hypothetical protein
MVMSSKDTASSSGANRLFDNIAINRERRGEREGGRVRRRARRRERGEREGEGRERERGREDVGG